MRERNKRERREREETGVDYDSRTAFDAVGPL